MFHGPSCCFFEAAKKRARKPRPYSFHGPAKQETVTFFLLLSFSFELFLGPYRIQHQRRFFDHLSIGNGFGDDRFF